MDKLLTVTEVARQLGVPEAEVTRLVQRGTLKALRLGGEVLRFHPEDVAACQAARPSARDRASSPTPRPSTARPSWLERVRDFLYAYDFYVVVALGLLLILAALRAMSS